MFYFCVLLVCFVVVIWLMLDIVFSGMLVGVC